MAVHCEYRVPDAVKAYFDMVKDGFTFPPLFKRNFWAVRRDHGF